MKFMFKVKSQKSYVKGLNGVAALPTMLILGGLAIEIIIAVTTTSYIFSESEFGTRFSNEALLAAKAGVQDAAMKIVRDKNFTQATTTLTVNNATTDVSVCKDAPCAAIGKQKIISLGKSQSKRRQLEAILNVDSLTGEVRLESLKEN